MARRKKTAKKTSSRRRRVGAIGGDGLKLVIGAIAGSIAATYAGNMVTGIDGKIKNGVMIAGGVLLSKQSNPFIKGAALGIAAKAGHGLLMDFGVIGAGPMLDFDRQISGFDSYPNNPQLNAIAGFNSFPNRPELNVISGVGNTDNYRAMSGAGMI